MFFKSLFSDPLVVVEHSRDILSYHFVCVLVQESDRLKDRFHSFVLECDQTRSEKEYSSLIRMYVPVDRFGDPINL